MADDFARGKGAGPNGRSPGGSGRRAAASGRALGAVLADVTAPILRQHRTPAARLMLDWEQIVGPALARFSAPRRLSAGTLSIACAGPVGMEIQHQAPQLIERINVYFGSVPRAFTDGGGRFSTGLPVMRLRVVQEAMSVDPSPADVRPTRRAPTPVSLPDMEDGPLRAVLERLGGVLGDRRKR